MQTKEPTIYLVSCVKTKRKVPSVARDLYVSTFFKKARAYVEASECRWFILSAEHGLVAPEQEIAPYEKTLKRMPVEQRRAWGARVCTQLDREVPELAHVVFLAGHGYREFILRHLAGRGVTVSIPMKGKRNGEQLKWLGENVPVKQAGTFESAGC